MLRPRRFRDEVDPGPVQIQARKVQFEVADAPLHWIPGHPAASHVVSVLNLVLPAGERWFVQTFNEALPMVKDPKLADDIRGFVGRQGTLDSSLFGMTALDHLRSWRIEGDKLIMTP